MDTKWKSIRRVFCFIFFFLGVSLTLGNLPAVLLRAPGAIASRIRGKQSGDYQQSGDFRQLISRRLEDFLSIAVNGVPVGSYYNVWDGYAESYLRDYYENSRENTNDPVFEDWIRQTVAEETDIGYEAYPDENMSEAERVWYLEHGLDPSYQWEDPEELESRLTEEERERLQKRKEAMTRLFFDEISGDKNLLYSISYNGEQLYSNGELRAENGRIQAPEGYNFLLYFDGEKVSITKDGQEIDIYGDGYYREPGREWYVPGYRNFPVSEEMKKAVICMAAAKEPVKYTLGPDKDGGYREQANEFYWMNYRLAASGKMLTRNAWGLCVGLMLLTLYFSFFNREARRQAAERLAAVQGRIWAEGKLLLAGVFIYNELRILAEHSQVYGDWGELFRLLREGGLAAGEYLEYLPWDLLYLPGTFWVILFWLLYLTVNDLRYNKKNWRQGLISRCCEAFSARELKQPLTRRMVHRNAVLFAATCLTGILLVMATVWGVSNYARWQYEETMGVCFFIAGGLLLVVWQVTRKNAETARAIEALTERIGEICSGDYSSRGADSENSGEYGAGSGVDGETTGEYGAGSGVDDKSGANRKGSRIRRKPGRTAAGRDLETAMNQLENIRQGMAGAVDEQMKSERMKVELIANVSHDLKTPLTSIISYVQFLKEEKELPEHVRDYVTILDEKSQRLNQMVQDVFSVSKAASGELPMHMEELDFGKLLRQTLADMDEEIQGSRVTFRTELPEKPVMIMADGQRMYRVFQNLFQNALKYSLDGSRVYVALKTEGKLAVASVKNTSHMELDEDQNFTERFFRGDKSRTDGGSGLGLSIAQSFTEACGGQFELEFNADLFTVKISFACRQQEA